MEYNESVRKHVYRGWFYLKGLPTRDEAISKLKSILGFVISLTMVSIVILSIYISFLPMRQVFVIETPVNLVIVEEMIKVYDNCTSTESRVLTTISTWTVTNTTTYEIYDWNIVVMYTP